MVIVYFCPILQPHDKLSHSRSCTHPWMQESSGNLFFIDSPSPEDTLLNTTEKYLIIPQLTNIPLNFFLKLFFEVSKSYMQQCSTQRENVSICKGQQAKNSEQRTVYMTLTSQLNHFWGKRHGYHVRI